MQENRKLPRNFRQMGERDSLYRIYIEDYVDTFLRKLGNGRSTKAGFLLGEAVTLEEEKCWFINGAVVVDDLWGKEEEAKFDDRIWNQAQQDMDVYFPGMEICGWFLKEAEEENLDFLILQQIHREAFPEGENLLLVCQRDETKLWAGGDGDLNAVSGFYIYYERNKQMQEYMIKRNEGTRVDAVIEDKTTRNFRTIMMEKKEEAGQKHNAVMYRVCVGLAVVVLVLGINNYISFREMNQLATQAQSVEEQLQAVNATVMDQGGAQPQEQPALDANETADAGNTSDPNADGTEGEQSSGMQESAGQTETQKEMESDYQWRELETEVNAGIHYFEVKPGDTLIYISVSVYGTTDMVSKICELNEIDDPNAIAIGQKIQLP